MQYRDFYSRRYISITNVPISIGDLISKGEELTLKKVNDFLN